MISFQGMGRFSLVVGLLTALLWFAGCGQQPEPFDDLEGTRHANPYKESEKTSEPSEPAKADNTHKFHLSQIESGAVDDCEIFSMEEVDTVLEGSIETRSDINDNARDASGAAAFCRWNGGSRVLDLEISRQEWVLQTMQRFDNEKDAPCPWFPNRIYGQQGFTSAGVWCQAKDAPVNFLVSTQGDVGAEGLTPKQIAALGVLMEKALARVGT